MRETGIASPIALQGLAIPVSRINPYAGLCLPTAGVQAVLCDIPLISPGDPRDPRPVDPIRVIRVPLVQRA